MRTFEVLSQYLLIVTKLVRTISRYLGANRLRAYTGIGGGTKWEGIQIMKTAILIQVLGVELASIE